MMLTIMPTTTPPLLKRRLSSRLNHFDDESYLPKTKRRHLYSNASLQNQTEYGVQLRPRNETIDHLRYSPSIRRYASIKAQLHLSNLFKEENSINPTLSVSNGDVSHLPKCNSGSPSVMEVVDPEQVDTVDDEIPVVNIKKNRVRLSESLVLEKFSTPSDVESDSSESSRTSIPKSQIKQPAIVLMKMNQPVKKKLPKSASPSPRPMLPELPNVVFGGYVHRMASLNARACVAAYLEPEKKYTPKYLLNKAKAKCSASPSYVKPEAEPKKAEKEPQTVTEPQKPVPEVVKQSDEEMITFEGKAVQEEPSDEPIEIVGDSEASVKQSDSDADVSFNKEGILYNGDTVHPNAQVFLTGMSTLKLPAKVIPQLVPARLSTVKRATQKAASTGVLHIDKRRSKKNNGWHPLGEPIKVIEYREGSSKKKTRKYYAGIRRRREDVYVRDCVVIKADVGDDKPYVAKIGGIWQDQDGLLMMTTFWYYRPDDVKLLNPAVNCVGRELLASQHHDTNCVACIEDKCYVLGYSQYCRYHASVVKSTIVNPFCGFSSNQLVPELPLFTQASKSQDLDHLDREDDDSNLVEIDPTKQEFEHLSPPLSELLDIDPFLVYLCYRGFNHISGKVQNGKPLKI